MYGEQTCPFAQGKDKWWGIGIGAITKPDRERDPRDDFANPGAKPPDDGFRAQQSVIPEYVEKLVKCAPHGTTRQNDMRKLMCDRQTPAGATPAQLV